MSKPKAVLYRQHNVVCSSWDRIRRVGLQDGSMVEHLVMGLKTSPNHMGSALETGGWQFIDQHGHMRRLNQVNLSGCHRSPSQGCEGRKHASVTPWMEWSNVECGKNLGTSPWRRDGVWLLRQSGRVKGLNYTMSSTNRDGPWMSGGS
ncbi:hypothetical protein TNCV_4130391 [Trichonephila clavipes]|nr:hypothetical protein TNCV_4130391 [Trichonephila clavipes]